jgi:hypothetical protein
VECHVQIGQTFAHLGDFLLWEVGKLQKYTKSRALIITKMGLPSFWPIFFLKRI